MISRIDIKELRFFPGNHSGLLQNSAVVTLVTDDEIQSWIQPENLVEKIPTLNPADPLWQIEIADWPGAFLYKQMPNNTFAHWTIALTIAFQRWARDPVFQGRVLSQGKNHITLVLPWQREEVFKEALSLALRHLLLWTQTEPEEKMVTGLTKERVRWIEKKSLGGLAPNGLRFAQAAYQRNIPVNFSHGFLHLGWGCHRISFDSSFTSQTGNIATRIARNKSQTNQLLQSSALPVPTSAVAVNWPSAVKQAEKWGWPVVIKPGNQDQGFAVVPNIQNEALLKQAYDEAEKYSKGHVIIEKHVPGHDYRMLVVKGQLIMCTQRIPGCITGDGVQTVKQLIDQTNKDPRRSNNKRSMLIALSLDDEALTCLSEQALTPDSIPSENQSVPLRRTANISTGGTAIDFSDKVHPDNKALAERAARIIGLDIAGVDFLCPDITRSWHEVGGAICEINAQPGFRPHWLGAPHRDINGEILDQFFANQPSRIPTAAITGSNGKSTVSHMLHHILMQSGKNTGLTTTSGVWLGHNKISHDNLSGQPGGKIILQDPAIEAAVIEMPRKGLIIFGHPCDYYDVSALLNIQDDHIGEYGINSLDKMAQVKANVLERTRKAIVINAEDPRCLRVALRIAKKTNAPELIMVARNASSISLRQHLYQGGKAVFMQQHKGINWMVFAESAQQTPIMPIDDIPATCKGIFQVNEINGLFSAALAWAMGITTECITQSLTSFHNTIEQSPGRYNFIEGYPFQVLLDFAHNPDSVSTLCQSVAQLPVTGKCRLLSTSIGNRSHKHIEQVAPLLAELFDEFILSCQSPVLIKSNEYTSDEPVAEMLNFYHKTLIEHGVSDKQIIIQDNLEAAVQEAINISQPGDLLVSLTDLDKFPLLETAL